MLLEGLYSFINKTENDGSISYTIELNENHDIFKGHFPGSPILPGVCSLQILKACCEDYLTKPLQYVSISSCKYINTVDPTVNKIISFNFTLTPNDNQFQLAATGIMGDAKFIKLKAVLVAE